MASANRNNSDANLNGLIHANNTSCQYKDRWDIWIELCRVKELNDCECIDIVDSGSKQLEDMTAFKVKVN